MKTLPNANRRAFVKNGALFLLGSAATLPTALQAADSDAVPGDSAGHLLRAGLITDLHYADKEPLGTRHYRETLDKIAEAGAYFEKQKPEFIVELGDLIDAADSVETEMGYLRTIHREFAALPGNKHCVLGNHCVDTLTKQEFLDGVGQKDSYYSFDSAGVHFVILDACFRSDGTAYQRKNFQWTDANIPAEELEWLRADLETTSSNQVIVFAHQRLDLDEEDKHTVNNASEVRKVLEASSKVSAVFQGHSHKNDHHEVGGIHYATLVAMVEGSGAESSGYSTLDVFEDGTLRIDGQREQDDYRWQ